MWGRGLWSVCMFLLNEYTLGLAKKGREHAFSLPKGASGELRLPIVHGVTGYTGNRSTIILI